MKVVFLQDLPGVAQAGEVKDVADGHARNYLFPRGLALLATAAEIERLEARRQAEARRRDQQMEEAQTLAQALQDVSLVFPRRVGAGGNIYGSVPSTAIAQELQRRGFKVDKHVIKIEEPIRKLGDHEVEIELGKGVVARIKVTIEAAGEGEVTE
ncbi:MAG: 50S ribosomal protein L9 [Chloroflexi bacterium]|nr:50S ribosomal protein L9 [Chloroflexota bacterium]MBT9165439.1 50S ribosomal protein L9 [Chloroflexota bacterium]